MSSSGKYTLSLLAVSLHFNYYAFSHYLIHFQDDTGIDSGLNVPSTSTPGPASAPAPTPASEPIERKLTPLQQLIKDTLQIPDHFTTKFNGGDIRTAYARYLAVGDAKRRLSKLATENVWTQKQPTVEEVAGLFASKSTYWSHSDAFAEVPNFPRLEKWLLNEEDAPADSVLWGAKRPSYKKLDELVKLKEKKEKTKGKKGKKKQQEYSSGHSSEEITDKKGKGKKRADGDKKGSSSKSYRL